MKTKLNPYKGARDFYPEDKLFQEWMFSKWQKIVEKYGYVEYGAPILEPTELFLMKGSEEIINEQTYTFKDRGERSVTIRTEMTPSVSRMIAARRQELAYPVRWYSIPNMWRYERMQRGRSREFWQLNVDLFGVESIDAEIEMIQIIDELFQSFGAKRSSYTIKINSRVLVNEILSELGFSKEANVEIVRLVDKIDKLSNEEFLSRLNKLTNDKNTSNEIIKLFAVKSPNDLPDKFAKSKPAENLVKIIKSVSSMGILNLEFDLSLMRGFDYYTDIVFEVFDNSPENNRAMFGGGRYDGLVGLLGADPVATVGFGVGDIPFKNFLEVNKLIPKLKLPVQVTVIAKENNDMPSAKAVASQLRECGINTSIDLSQRKFDKQLKSADKSNVSYVVIVGRQEISDEKFTLKNMISGKEQKHSIERIASIVSS